MQEMQETWVQSMGQEDPLEKEMATHSSPLAWEIPQTEEPDRLQSTGSQESQTWLSNWTTICILIFGAILKKIFKHSLKIAYFIKIK